MLTLHVNSMAMSCVAGRVLPTAPDDSESPPDGPARSSSSPSLFASGAAAEASPLGSSFGASDAAPL